MDINFVDNPNLIPKPRPEIRVEEIHAEPLEDGRRIRIELRITPFTPADRPNITVQVLDPHGADVGTIAVIETMHNNVAMTFHLREAVPLPGAYKVQASLYYEEQNSQGTAETTVHLLG